VLLVVEMRALLCRVASVFLLLALVAAAEARASDPPRVLVVAPAPRSPVVERALPLIRGELAGVGLSAEMRDDEPQNTPTAQAVYGLLSLETNGSTTVIRAFAPGDPKPIVANVDADEAGVDAEVLAVRAVETLRAAVLQFAQAHQEGLPDAVRGFAQLQKAPVAPAPAPPRQRRPPRSQPARSQAAPALQAFLGPQLAWHPRLTPSVGAEGGLIVGPRWGFVGAAFESTLYRSRVSSSAGHANILRRALSLELGARFRLAQAWEISTRVGTGYADYAVTGKGNPGYVGVDLDHRALIASLAVGGAYYFGRALGVYLNFAGAVAFDAPVVQLATEDQSTLDHPSLTVSSGALLTLF
jgi:hypothetical protein